MINKPYKFKRENFDEILFTSDQHFNHDPKWDNPLWNRRGFKSVKEHDAWLIHQYQQVSGNSLIISLGDPALNSTPENMLGLFNQTSAPILHLWGNHFSCDYRVYKSAMIPYFKNLGIDFGESLPLEVYPFTVNRTYPTIGLPKLVSDESSYALTYLGMQAVIQIDKTMIHLSHMAPLIWTRDTIGCLYGHSHGELEGSQPSDKTNGKRLDCGIENSRAYNDTAFFTYEDVVRILNSKPAKVIDHA